MTTRRDFLGWVSGIFGGALVLPWVKPKQPRYVLWDYHRPTGARIRAWEISPDYIHPIKDPKNGGMMYAYGPPFLKGCQPPDYGDCILLRTDLLLMKDDRDFVSFLEIRS